MKIRSLNKFFPLSEKEYYADLEEGSELVPEESEGLDVEARHNLSCGVSRPKSVSTKGMKGASSGIGLREIRSFSSGVVSLDMFDMIEEKFGDYIVETEERLDGLQCVLEFDNGYGASCINHKNSYGNEIAVVDLSTGITYDTPVTSDVEGHLSVSEAEEVLYQIQALNKSDKDLYKDPGVSWEWDSSTKTWISSELE